MWSQLQAPSGTPSTRMFNAGFTEDSPQGAGRIQLAVDKASTVSGVEADQHWRPCDVCEHLTPSGAVDDEICGAHNKRPCDICEGLAVHPDLDPVPAPRTIEEARAARRH